MSRPLNSRIKPAARRRGRMLAPFCGGRVFRAVLAVIPCVLYRRGADTIVGLPLLSAASESLSGGVLITHPSGQRKELNLRTTPTHHPDE